MYVCPVYLFCICDSIKLLCSKHLKLFRFSVLLRNVDDIYFSAQMILKGKHLFYVYCSIDKKIVLLFLSIIGTIFINILVCIDGMVCTIGRNDVQR